MKRWVDREFDVSLFCGDCLHVLRELASGSIDSIVTDPPYGLSSNKKGGSGAASMNSDSPTGRARVTTGSGFMGLKWDADVPGVEVWRECLRMLKPGGHLLSFAGTRTHHRMAVNIEDAGFEIRDMIAWVYGSGFPKSLDVSKAIDKAAGAKRAVVGEWHKPGRGSRSAQQNYGLKSESGDITVPATQAPAAWDGWGTALKPAFEPIILARRPLDGTVASNVLSHGVGGLNIDGCRVDFVDAEDACESKAKNQHFDFGSGPREGSIYGDYNEDRTNYDAQGRWPANFIHDGSDEVVGLFPYGSSGAILPHHRSVESENRSMNGKNYARVGRNFPTSAGSASRFFYCAKASKSDRETGLEEYALRSAGEVTGGRVEGSAGLENPRAGAGSTSGARNYHPTVKPTSLMRYLVRLVTPPGGVVLDPFMGSGSTGRAAVLECFGFRGIELDAGYFDLSVGRVRDACTERRGGPLFAGRVAEGTEISDRGDAEGAEEGLIDG